MEYHMVIGPKERAPPPTVLWKNCPWLLRLFWIPSVWTVTSTYYILFCIHNNTKCFVCVILQFVAPPITTRHLAKTPIVFRPRSEMKLYKFWQAWQVTRHKQYMCSSTPNNNLLSTSAFFPNLFQMLSVVR